MMKNKTTAAILAFFLGGLGIHRFYLGQNGLGLVYLIFCWTLIPALIAFVDFVIFLTMSEHYFNSKYNKEQPALVSGTTNKVSANIISPSKTDELAKLHNLMERGALSEAEFEREKQRLLNQ